jgi:hypothetical protein
VYAAPDPAPAVTHDQIARRAYEIYEARGADEGDALADWLTAERELRQRTSAPGAAPGTPRDVYH